MVKDLKSGEERKTIVVERRTTNEGVVVMSLDGLVIEGCALVLTLGSVREEEAAAAKAKADQEAARCCLLIPSSTQGSTFPAT